MYQRKQNWVKHLDFILFDVLSLHIAFVLAYITRNGFQSPYNNSNYVTIAFIYTFADVLVCIFNNSMKGVLKRGFYKEFVQTLKHICLVELAIVAYLFSVKQSDDFSRIVIYLLAAYYLIISYCVRLLWKRFLLNGNRKLNYVAYYITTYARAHDVVSDFLSYEPRHAKLGGICILDKDCVGEKICGVSVTANAENVLSYLCDKWVDEVFLALPIGQQYPLELVNALADMGIVVHVEMEQAHDFQWQKQAFETIGGKTVLTISMTMATTMQLFLKRALDIVGGIVGCILTGLLTLILGPMIYIKSPGPIFFTQVRVGKNGKKFKMYKFRSMYLDAEQRKAELMKENRIKDGMMFKLDFDPRIIGSKKLPDGTIKKGIGNIIRDWSIDEFPQFFNVLKGDLSLCGTRPPTVDEWEKYELHHRARLSIKPGITGLWQVSGRSNITDFEQVVELDKKYIREWSIGLDLKILLQTVKVVLGKEGSM
ncbi:MAG: sugar transferase [Oscillospiraceae bacterium]|nr:sugar transferase [Oscillospiraceae bacterium]